MITEILEDLLNYAVCFIIAIALITLPMMSYYFGCDTEEDHPFMKSLTFAGTFIELIMLTCLLYHTAYIGG